MILIAEKDTALRKKSFLALYDLRGLRGIAEHFNCIWQFESRRQNKSKSSKIKVIFLLFCSESLGEE